MQKQDQKIILIKRRTRLEELVARYNTVDQAKFYIEHMGSDFNDYVEEDSQYRHVIVMAQQLLEKQGRVQMLDRDFLPNFIFGPTDIVVVVGQDGLVANTLKYLEGQAVIGINPDVKRWEGVLLPFQVEDLSRVVPEVIRRTRKTKEVTMAKASMKDGQYLYGVNDLFIGQKTHVSARYELHLGRQHERQSSSGIIVSTGLGATGWLKSVLAGANQVVSTITGNSNSEMLNFQATWHQQELYFTVREPYPSRYTQAELVFGKITPEQPLQINSQMSENGVIFSDGIESDFLEFNAGAQVIITLADKKGCLIV